MPAPRVVERGAPHQPAVDLALAGHLSPTGKGHATPAELADDLLGYLRAATRRETG
jgi:hypothetical protein